MCTKKSSSTALAMYSAQINHLELYQAVKCRLGQKVGGRARESKLHGFFYTWLPSFSSFSPSSSGCVVMEMGGF